MATLSIVCACLMLSSLIAPASANDDEDDDEQTSWHEKTNATEVGNKEVWAGAQAVRSVWALYSGTTWAPFANLQQDGLRLRTQTTYGKYRYTTGTFDIPSRKTIQTTYQGLSRTLDFLAGYQWSHGGLTAKAFGGVQFLAQTTTPEDPDSALQGRTRGLKGALELWYNITPKQWASLDLTYATPLQSYATRLRAAHRFGEDWSVGAEAVTFGTSDGGTRRYGAFVRFDNSEDELTVSGGRGWSDGSAAGLYATAQWMRRF